MKRTHEQARDRLEALTTMLAEAIKDSLLFIDGISFTLMVEDLENDCTACVSNMDRKELIEQMGGIAEVLNTPEAKKIDEAHAKNESVLLDWPRKEAKIH